MMLKSKKRFGSVITAALTALLCVVLGVALVLPGQLTARTAGAADATVTKTTYYADFPDLAAEQESAAVLNKQIAEEGMTLLKNENALPLSASERNITVFGKGSTSLVYGGSGSGSGTGDYVTLQDALAQSGFNVNPLVTRLYTNVKQEVLDGVVFGNSSGSSFIRESDPDDVLSTASGSYALYNDAAVVVLSRSGGEGSDLPMYSVTGHKDLTEHYLELDDNEKKLLEIVKANFDKIIIVVNSSNALELGTLKNDEDIDAILWMGAPGTNGTLAVGGILNGSVNPSGRTVDIFPADFKKDPTWYNIGDNGHTHFTGVDGQGNATYDTRLGANGEYISDYTTVRVKNSDGTYSTPVFNDHEYYTLTYKEGIYLGYRYYETVADLMDAADTTDNNAGEEWYDATVAYPFGYGLSYTTFDMAMSDITDTGSALKFTVTVTNTGDVAGKQVVEIYSDPPYVNGEVEKATANIVTFDKTDIIAPGDSQELEFTVTYRELASYDATDLNDNDAVGYELDAGDYTISVNSDSHTIVDSRVWTLASDQTHVNNPEALEEPVANFSAGDEFSLTREASLDLQGETVTFTGVDMAQLSRASGAGVTYPLLTDGAASDVAMLKTDLEDDLTFSQAAIDYLNDEESIYAYEDTSDDPWYIPETELTTQGGKMYGWEQAGQRPDGLGKTAIQLWDMSGVPYGDAKWVEFMNQMTYFEMVELLSEGHYYNIANERIGKPYVHDVDGPAQLKGNLANGYFWCSASIISSTYNTDLAYLMGLHVGNESILTDTNGWYGPSMNIHRSPFSGRNFEYWSQDGTQGGIMAAQAVKGAREKGTHTYVKHFALNDQETHRHGIMTWAGEQAAREIYFRNFEYAVTRGGANGTMTSFNRVGLNPASNHALYIDLLCDEWGYVGISVTDGNGNGSTAYGWNGNNDARALVFPLSYGYPGITTPEEATGANMEGYYDAATNMLYIPSADQAKNGVEAVTGTTRNWTTHGVTQWYWVRTSAMNMLYVIANSNAMDNGIDATGFADQTIELTQGVAYTHDYSTDIPGGSSYNFEVTDGALPDGITLTALGVLSGKATVSGTYTAEITGTVDNYITQTAVVTFNVSPLFTTTVSGTEVAGDTITLTKGTSYQGAINVTVTDEDLTRMGYNVPGGDTHLYNITAQDLPAGMDVEASADGVEIFGTPTESGTYSVTVRLDWTDQDGGRRGRATTIYYSQTYTISVPEVSRTVTVDYNCTELSDSTVSVADGGNFTLQTPTRAGYVFAGWYADSGCTVAFDFTSAVNADTTVYAGWTQIQAPVDNSAEIDDLTERVEALENAGSEEEGGCGGSVASVLGIGAFALAGAAVCVLLMKKASKKD